MILSLRDAFCKAFMADCAYAHPDRFDAIRPTHGRGEFGAKKRRPNTLFMCRPFPKKLHLPSKCRGSFKFVFRNRIGIIQIVLRYFARLEQKSQVHLLLMAVHPNVALI
jgi:hypothetical protein